MQIFWIGAGGFLGAVSRFLATGTVQRLLGRSAFPWGTFAVNISGCLLIGFLGGIGEGKNLFSDHARSFLFIGFLGGFTTFSTLGYETFGLFRDGQSLAALANMGLQLTLGLGAVACGLFAARWV